MSQAEIRWWLTELRRRYGWGTRVLGRTMGLSNEAHLDGKASGKQWIYRGEQIRMSYQLRRIISGELVCMNGAPGRGHAGKAVIADRPQPLRPGLHWHVDLKRGTAYLEPTEPPPTPLPSFRTLLDNPRPWRKR